MTSTIEKNASQLVLGINFRGASGDLTI